MASARRVLPVIDTAFAIKLEESKTIEPNKASQVDVTSMESFPTTDVETIPSYSSPKLPARLYFSPTLLQDNEEPEPIQTVLSTIDQNQTSR